jgi:hypothetical protein
MVLVLATLVMLLAGETLLGASWYLPSGSVPIDIAALLVSGFVVFIGSCLRWRIAWHWGRIYTFAGIVVNGAGVGRAIRGLQAGTVPWWMVLVLLVHILLLGIVYYGLGRPASREYFGLSRPEPPGTPEPSPAEL